MNFGVEIALIAAVGGVAARAIDLVIRKGVIKTETLARADRIAKEIQDRADRLSKEQADRELAADIAVITHVPAWVELEETLIERELRRDLDEEKGKNRVLEAKIAELSLKPKRSKHTEQTTE